MPRTAPPRWARPASPSTVPGSRGRARRAAALIATLTLAAVGTAVGTAPAHAAPAPTSTLVVNADQVLRPVTHVASGALYGLATDTVPADNLVQAIKPNTFVQMAPGGGQLPNGEPAPAGDALVVAPEAAKAGAKVVVRMPDWYPNFPYRWVSWDDWLHAVDTQVRAVQASAATNIAAYELWNEPDWTWNSAAAGSFNDGWTRTFREVRSLDPTTPIQGPSYSDNISGMRSFLQNAVATNTVPDIISWHELETSAKIEGDIATVTALEQSLGITPRPIAIEEYATTAEVGVPGALVGYIAKFERYGVHDAELAFWNHYGTLGDTLVDTGASPNGAYWLYRWYGDMSGNMVVTVPPNATTGLDGAAAVTSDKKQVSVIFGGGSGASAVQVNGLDTLELGTTVHARLEYTPSFGRTNPVSGPVTISDTVYPVTNGSITVPVAMNAAGGYHLVISSGGEATHLEGAYTITNLNSGLALDTQNAAPSAGTPVDQATVSGAATQSWTLVPAAPGLYKIVNTASGLVLGVQDASTNVGASIQVGADAGTNDQLWQVVPDGNGHDKLVSYNSGLVLAVAGMSKDPGAQVVQAGDGVLTPTGTGARPAGKLGNAVTLSGSNNYVSAPAGVVKGLTGDFTISAWVNPTKNSTWSRLFDFGTGTSNYMFLTLNAGAGLRFAITTSGGGGEQQISSTTTLPLNTWSLVTVTLSGTTATLYVNGQAVGTNTNLTLHPSALGNTTQDWIGRSEYSADPYLAASVDDLNIYSRALSSTEVASLAAGQVGAGDVLHYTFDEATGAAVADSSGNGRDASIVSGSQPAPNDAATPDHFWTLIPRVTLKGFFSPVQMGAVLNTVQAGSTVPIKFQAFSGTTELTDPSLVTMTTEQVTCAAGATTSEITQLDSGGSPLRYDGHQFHDNWQTPNTPGACYRVTAATPDGSRLAALFQLR